jgi:hypothetical protein
MNVAVIGHMLSGQPGLSGDEDISALNFPALVRCFLGMPGYRRRVWGE